MEIREGVKDEIRKFELYDEENEGSEIIVAEENGEIVGYIQKEGCEIYFIESSMKGCGRALIEYLQSEYDELRAINCLPGAIPFYEKMGFEIDSHQRWNHPDYVWFVD